MLSIPNSHISSPLNTLTKAFQYFASRIGSNAHVTFWLLTTPTIIVIKCFHYLFQKLDKYRSLKYPVMQPVINLFKWAIKIPFQISFLSILYPVSILSTESKSIKTPEKDPCLKNISEDLSKNHFSRTTQSASKKNLPPKKIPNRHARPEDKLFIQILLNSAIRRYYNFLVTLQPSHLINIYRYTFFLTATYTPPANILHKHFQIIKAKATIDFKVRQALIDQLIYQAIGCGFINPQEICLGIQSPLLKPLPAAEALKLISERLAHHKLLN